MAFLLRQLATIVPGLAGAKVSVGRVRKEEKWGEPLQGTNILRYLEHHLVFICNTCLSGTPEHPYCRSCRQTLAREMDVRVLEAS